MSDWELITGSVTNSDIPSGLAANRKSGPAAPQNVLCCVISFLSAMPHGRSRDRRGKTPDMGNGIFLLHAAGLSNGDRHWLRRQARGRWRRRRRGARLARCCAGVFQRLRVHVDQCGEGQLCCCDSVSSTCFSPESGECGGSESTPEAKYFHRRPTHLSNTPCKRSCSRSCPRFRTTWRQLPHCVRWHVSAFPVAMAEGEAAEDQRSPRDNLSPPGPARHRRRGRRVG